MVKKISLIFLLVLFMGSISAVEVECTTNDACSNGEICDLSTTNYGHCIKSDGGFDLAVNYQPNIVCKPDSITCLNAETLKLCSSDGTNFETKDCKIGCLVEEDTARSYCINDLYKEKPDSTTILLITIVGLLLIILLVTLFNKKKS